MTTSYGGCMRARRVHRRALRKAAAGASDGVTANDCSASAHTASASARCGNGRAPMPGVVGSRRVEGCAEECERSGAPRSQRVLRSCETPCTSGLPMPRLEETHDRLFRDETPHMHSVSLASSHSGSRVKGMRRDERAPGDGAGGDNGGVPAAAYQRPRAPLLSLSRPQRPRRCRSGLDHVCPPRLPRPPSTCEPMNTRARREERRLEVWKCRMGWRRAHFHETLTMPELLATL
jgi:hypothetical protein